MFIMYGPERTGKSTFVKTLQALFGRLAMRTSVSTFSDSTPTRNNLASLKGARVVIVDENDGEESGYLSSALLKQVVSGERVEARHLYQERFEFDVMFKLIIATNHLPAFKIFDGALRRRIVPIPFQNQISEEANDTFLFDRIQRELPGILNWAIQGWELVRRHGLRLPFPVQRLLHDYSLNFNSFERFIRDACIIDHSAKVSSSSLYRVYVMYCKANGERSPMKHKSLAMRLDQAGFEKVRITQGVYYKGLRPISKDLLLERYELA